MSSFNARLRLPHSKLPLGVEVDISHERMTLTSGERTVAAWPLDKLEVDNLADGFHIKVDGDDFVLNVTDSLKFASEVGMERRPDAGTGPDLTEDTSRNGSTFTPVPERDRADEMERRIDEVSEALTSDTMSPAQAFAEWMGLLKEINRRHGQGSIPTDVFYRLNTRLLDLIPESVPDPS